jgi:hypothetical protein
VNAEARPMIVLALLAAQNGCAEAQIDHIGLAGRVMSRMTSDLGPGTSLDADWSSKATSVPGLWELEEPPLVWLDCFAGTAPSCSVPGMLFD